MKILSLSPDDAIGHLSVHAIRTDDFKIKKGSFISDKMRQNLKTLASLKLFVPLLKKTTFMKMKPVITWLAF